MRTFHGRSPFRRIVLTALLVVGLLAALFSLYLSAVRKQVIKNECEVLSHMSAQTSLTVARQIDSDFETLKSLAARLEWPADDNAEGLLSALRDATDTHVYKAMGLAFEDGHAFSTNAAALDLRERTYLHEAFQGNTLISKTLADKVDGEPVNVYATPVVREGRTKAVLYAAIPTTFFKQLLAAPQTEERHAYVAHRDGTLAFWSGELLPTADNNLFEMLDTATRHSPVLTTLQRQVHEGVEGLFTTHINGSLYYISSIPLKVNDWHLLTLVSDKVIEARVSDFVNMTLLLVTGLLVIVLALFCFFYRAEVRSRRIINDKVKELSILASSIPGGVIQTCNDAMLDILYVNPELCHMLGYGKKAFLDTFDRTFVPVIDDEDLPQVLEALRNVTPDNPQLDLEYRLVHERGHRIWVRERVQLYSDNSRQILCGVILSIQNEKEALQRILMDTERYRLLFDLSDSILFDLDMGTGRIAYSKKFTELFGGELVQHNFPQSSIDAQTIHPADIGLFVDFFERLYGGAESLEQELRLMGKLGEYIWCNVSGTTIFDADQVNSKVIGRIDIIETQKRQLEDLKTKNQLDPFTKLYNKVSTLHHIRAYLEDPASEPAVFFIVDIDNFKYVNDTFGHSMGDTVILGLAEELRHAFRETDIIGRIGGDEFVVLAKGIRNMNTFAKKLPVIAKRVHHVLQSGETTHYVSTSMGTAFFPENGITYEDLYRRADEALYFTKQVKGKNGISTYNETQEHAAKGEC